MEKEEIIRMGRKMNTKQDLIYLLNQIKMDEMTKSGTVAHFHPIPLKKIDFYCNPKHTFHRYKQFKIPKKKSGEFRLITSPRTNGYMQILRLINEILKSFYTPSDYATGFIENRSIIDNAKLHIRKNYVYNIDLKDFFTSIDQARVWKRLQLEPFKFPVNIASIIAGLCCMKYVVDNNGDTTTRYVLPQGAPTSPIITNMVCDILDHRLAGVAKRFGLTYSRYADDITFSSMHNVYQKNGQFEVELKRIIENQGFTINTDKTRLQKIGNRQEVTGIVVNEKVNVTKKYIRDLRNIMYIWERYGITDAYSRFIKEYKVKKGHVKKGNPNMINVLDGKLMYLKMVKGPDDTVYKRLDDKFNHLLKIIRDYDKTNDNNTSVIETLTLLEFENKIHTEISINREIYSYSKPRASFTLNDETFEISIDRKLRFPINKRTVKISTCLNSKNEIFWLIHSRKKKIIQHRYGIVKELYSNENTFSDLMSDKINHINQHSENDLLCECELTNTEDDNEEIFIL